MKISVSQVQDLLKTREFTQQPQEYEVFEVIDSATDDPEFNF